LLIIPLSDIFSSHSYKKAFFIYDIFLYLEEYIIAKVLDVPVTELKDGLELSFDETTHFFDTTPSNKALLNNYYNKLNEK